MATPAREDHGADKALRDQLDALAMAESGHPRRRLVPDRWMHDPHWRCARFHVDDGFARDWHGRRVCVVDDCGSPVQLTFPEDASGRLP